MEIYWFDKYDNIKMEHDTDAKDDLSTHFDTW